MNAQGIKGNMLTTSMGMLSNIQAIIEAFGMEEKYANYIVNSCNIVKELLMDYDGCISETERGELQAHFDIYFEKE